MKILTIDSVRAAVVMLLVAYIPTLGAQTASQGARAVNQDSLVIGEFETQVKDYLKLHKKAGAGIPVLKPTDSAHKINQHRCLLASNIRAARPQAKQGDIFSPAITQQFRHLIAIAYEGADGAKVRESLRTDDPPRNVRVQVNATYPESAPLRSTPPSILLNLPNLPPTLDYRIVGRNLVLRDTEANIIVDYIPAAIPPS
jgi:hypothetical protein